ncbi:MAG TPA: Spy/CpxP family protein refolding chaperone [Planctomycetota bacterium]|nr:Spy/CpxP family protein refolding chaperone [Planctomycetota bacterium]
MIHKLMTLLSTVVLVVGLSVAVAQEDMEKGKRDGGSQDPEFQQGEQPKGGDQEQFDQQDRQGKQNKQGRQNQQSRAQGNPKGQEMAKANQQVCPIDTALSREGIDNTQAKTCPLCQMMTEAPSPAAWIMSKDDQINLTEKQRKSLRSMDTKFRKQQADRDADLAKRQATLNNVMARPKIDSGDLEDALEKTSQARIATIKAWMKDRDKALDTLKDEQRAKVMAMACAPKWQEQERGAQQKGAEAQRGKQNSDKAGS